VLRFIQLNDRRILLAFGPKEKNLGGQKRRHTQPQNPVFKFHGQTSFRHSTPRRQTRNRIKSAAIFSPANRARQFHWLAEL
jgi:hypothetical protein